MEAQRIADAADGLYGTPISLSTARLVLAPELMRGWAAKVSDVEGAYITATLRGPPAYVRLSPELWRTAGASPEAVAAAKDPCLRAPRATYRLLRAWFDWLAQCVQVLG